MEKATYEGGILSLGAMTCQSKMWLCAWSTKRRTCSVSLRTVSTGYLDSSILAACGSSVSSSSSSIRIDNTYCCGGGDSRDAPLASECLVVVAGCSTALFERAYEMVSRMQMDF